MYDIKSSDLTQLFSSVLFSWQGDPWVRTFSHYLFIYFLFMCLFIYFFYNHSTTSFAKDFKVKVMYYTTVSLNVIIFYISYTEYDNTNTITTLSSLPPPVLSAVALETCSKSSWSSWSSSSSKSSSNNLKNVLNSFDLAETMLWMEKEASCTSKWEIKVFIKCQNNFMTIQMSWFNTLWNFDLIWWMVSCSE